MSGSSHRHPDGRIPRGPVPGVEFRRFSLTGRLNLRLGVGGTGPGASPKAGWGTRHTSLRIVTCFQTLEKKGVTEAVLRFNPRAGGPAAEFFLPFHDPHAGPLWIGHPDQAIDVAIIQVNLDVLDKHGMQFNLFKSDTSAATIQTMSQNGVTEGDFVSVLGFPMGLIGGERNFVIVGSAVIARIRDALSDASDSFLVDAFIFTRNSGGPVVIKPETAGIQGTSHVERAYLIGIIKGYLYTRMLQSARRRTSLE